VCGPRILELFGGKLAQQFMHLIAPRCGHAHHGCLDEQGQGERGSTSDHTRGVLRKPALQHGEMCEHLLFLLGEQTPGLFEYRAHTAVTHGDILMTCRQNI
jgi:hypothetical protein